VTDLYALAAAAGSTAVQRPSTPLGPFADSAVAWTTWITLMGFVGLVVLSLVVAPVAARSGSGTGTMTTRLGRVAVVLGVLFVPAFFTDTAHDLSDSGGYAYGSVTGALFDGTNEGRLLGLELVLAVVAVVLAAPLALRQVAESRLRPWLLTGALLTSAVALGTTKFPDAAPDPGEWGRTSFETVMWMLHLGGGAVWIGGLIGLLALALPGGMSREDRAAFWSPAIRRFSVTAMSCVASIALSGLFLYWEHVDGIGQLFSTMYGRTLGVKILLFGSLLALGVVNQFWLHPRIDAMRAAGDNRSLVTILRTRFRFTVGIEAILGASILFVAPFLHGSARNQAFDAKPENFVAAGAKLPRLPAKEVTASTWAWGVAETVVVIGVMLVAYLISGRVAKNRVVSVVTLPAEPQAFSAADGESLAVHDDDTSVQAH
jgi:putative copper export protein